MALPVKEAKDDQSAEERNVEGPRAGRMVHQHCIELRSPCMVNVLRLNPNNSVIGSGENTADDRSSELCEAGEIRR